MATASAKRQCRVCGSWFMTTTQRDNHERQKHQSVPGQGRTRRPLAAGTGVFVREPGLYDGRFGVVMRPADADGRIGVKVHMGEGRTFVRSFRHTDLRVGGTR